MATVVVKRPRSSSASKHHGALYYPLPRRARFSFSPAPVPRPSSSPSASFGHSSFTRPSTSRPPVSSSAAPASSSSSLSAPRANITTPGIPTASGVSALEALLSRPLRFVPATNLTEEDEMVATLRPRKVKGDSIEQRRRRERTNHISSKWQVGAGLQPRGLHNFNGEVCYRHSVLQTLLHLPKFGNWLTDGHAADCSSTVTDLDEALEDLAMYLARNEWHVDGQQDATESVRFMLNTMREQVRPADQEMLDLLFRTKMSKSRVCRNPACRKSTAEPDTLEVIHSMYINPTITSLQPALLKQNFVTDLDDARCEHCGQLGADSAAYVTEAPDVLLLNFVRFNADMSKNAARIRYGKWLDLGAHVADPSLKPVKYQLDGVVHHKGWDLSGEGAAHYIAMAKGPNGTWATLDDEIVTRARFAEVVDPTLIEDLPRGHPDEWTPTILVYTRIC